MRVDHNKMDPLLDDPLDQIETDLDAQSLLLASANHDLEAIRNLLKTTPATVQDAETGFTPLHAAIASCEEDDVKQMNGDHVEESAERKKELESAAESVRLLLQSGAIWNDLDASDETPGCVARRLGLEEIYGIIVDAGVRAEILMARMDEYQFLAGDDEDDDEEDGVTIDEEETEEAEEAEAVDPSTNNETYVQDQLTISSTNILDSAANGVMMDWETPLMERHASLLLPTPGLRVLNVGHGMGIIDTFVQSHSPITHHIIEAHPSVLAKMKEDGWNDKAGVVIHEGRWQDILPELVSSGDEVLFDGIFFDTFAEEYKALREFFSEWVVQLLDSEGRFGFFNGMGADRQVCYDVYNKVSATLAGLRVVKLIVSSGC